MNSEHRLTLKLNGTSPERISMNVLAEYLSALSSLYGSTNDIHFESISEGSACLNSFADSAKIHSEVIARTIHEIKNQGKSHQRLVSLLTRDNLLSAEIIEKNGIVIGSILPELDSKIKISKKSSIQGRLYSIGGKDNTINIKIQGANNESLSCESSVEIATELSKLLFKYIKVYGLADWEKKKGHWRLKKLIIDKYEKLNESNLSNAISDISQASGNKWKKFDNSYEVIQKMRDID